METIEDITAHEEMGFDLQQDEGFGRLLGKSKKMEELFRIIPVIAQTDSSVLITGETGTGKDVLAEIIHNTSERKDGPFIKVNCGALPETLLESELFGHKKGAFTGAFHDKPGRVRLAHNGTLYLTEIGDLPLSLQVKLLTFLDDKVVYQLGDAKGFQADVRIIAATHRNLEKMVREGLFREDLLYRLNVVRLHMPPLRERGRDVELLLDHFTKVFSAKFEKKIKGLSKPLKEMLIHYPFPGNVRELKNIIEYAANISQEPLLKPEHIPAYLLEPQELMIQDTEFQETEPQELTASLDVSMGGTKTETNLGDIEKKLILDALLKTKGRKSKAAEMLGWCRSTLWRKMKHYQLEG
jgi:transcriptional regulator with PAS, ATPase and Fis domain